MILLRNPWDLSHILGGICLNWFFRFFLIQKDYFETLINMFIFLILGCVGTIIKELADEITAGTKYEGKWGLDPAGGDIQDIVRALYGSTIATLFLLFFDKV